MKQVQKIRQPAEQQLKEGNVSIPQSKDELLNAIETTFSKLAEDLRRVPADVSGLPLMEGHSKGELMSVSNLVSYLLGWNSLVLKWLERDEKGEPVDFPETGFKWNELGELAEKFYSDYQNVPFVDLVDRLRVAKEKIIGEISKRNNQEALRKRVVWKMDNGTDDPIEHLFSLFQCKKPPAEMVEKSRR